MTHKTLKKILSIFNRNISFHLNNRNYKDTSKVSKIPIFLNIIKDITFFLVHKDIFN